MSVRNSPHHFDVHQDASPSLVTWGPGLAYSQLFRFRSGPDVTIPSEEIECDLCETWEQIDPTTYRVTLRESARWQNKPPVLGRQLTAHDVAFSYQRQATAGWANAMLLRNIDRVKVINSTTLEIRTLHPDTELLANLADGHSKIIAKEVVVERGDLRDRPVIGSGPWILMDTGIELMEFVPNPIYYEPDTPIGNGLTIHVIPDGRTRLSALLTGLIDFYQPSFEDLTIALDRKSDLQSTTVPSPGIGVEVALNTSRPPLDKLDVRRAILKAWDPWRYIDDIWQGQAYVSLGLNTPYLSWQMHEDELRSFFGNPQEARNLLNATGLPAGSHIEIKVGLFSDHHVDHAHAMASDLHALGFSTSVIQVPTLEFAEKVWSDGDYQVFVGAQPPSVGLSQFLREVHHSDGGSNTHGYSSSVLDALIEKQSVEFDYGRRKDQIQHIQREIIAGAYRFNSATKLTHWVWTPHLKNFWPNLVRSNSHFLSRVGLSASEPDGN